MSFKLADVLTISEENDIQEVKPRYREIFEPVFGESESKPPGPPFESYTDYCKACAEAGRLPISRSEWNWVMGK